MSEISGYVKEESKPACRRFAQERDYVSFAADDLSGSCEIQLPWIEDNAVLADHLHLPLVLPSAPRQNFVMEMKIVTVWIDMLPVKRINDDHTATVFSNNTFAGENHGKILPSEVL